MDPHGYTTFCDDIREEVGGKLSLMGCYSGGLQFSGMPPGRMPKLCAQIHMLLPIKMKFESVVISVTREASDVTTMISEVKISSAEVEAQKLQLSKGEFLALTISQQWAPIEFQESCILKVRARVDDGNEIKLGALEVVFPDSRKEP